MKVYCKILVLFNLIIFPSATLAAAKLGTFQGPVDKQKNIDNLPSEYLKAQPLNSLALPTTKISNSSNNTPGIPGSELKNQIMTYGANISPLARTYGNANSPYTTARVAVTNLGPINGDIRNVPVSSFPYSPTGKLYFKIGEKVSWCSASLIRRGVVITAAHCLFNYGTNKDTGYYKDFVFCPANTAQNSGPYGCFTGTGPRVLGVWYWGADTCPQRGVQCNNDIGTLLIMPKIKIGYAGDLVGVYKYSWNLYGFVSPWYAPNIQLAEITQLAYPFDFDSGLEMQRTDSVGLYYVNGNFQNIVIGSAQVAGSDGGPWIINFGTKPKVTNNVNLGYDTEQVIAAVTSYYTYSKKGWNQAGASVFGQNKEYPGGSYSYGGVNYGSGNIGYLIKETCRTNASFC